MNAGQLTGKDCLLKLPFRLSLTTGRPATPTLAICTYISLAQLLVLYKLIFGELILETLEIILTLESRNDRR